jgi:hypothetical protein
MANLQRRKLSDYTHYSYTALVCRAEQQPMITSITFFFDVGRRPETFFNRE